MTLEKGTRILSRREVSALLSLEECIGAVEEALDSHARGGTIPPAVLGVPVEGGGFHIKTAGLLDRHPLFAAKLNGNFHDNCERFGLPRIQGLLLLCDAQNGSPLAVMDSTEITLVRTGAATAVAARHLAKEDSETVTICGCGLQGWVQLAAIRCVRPIRKAYLWDCDPLAADRLARRLAGDIHAEAIATEELARALRDSDICLTCTPSRSPFLTAGLIPEGLFLAAVGADSEEKQELDPLALKRSKLVVDHLEQCSTIGELHHALEAGVLLRSDVHAELSEVVSGAKPGRTSADEVFIFDSTGVALQDVAAAALVYRRAVERNVGIVLDLLH